MIPGAKLLLNAKTYIESFLKIQTKDGKLVPFKMNEPQRRFYSILREEWEKKKPVRIIVLKARQEGISTETEGILFWASATRPDINSLIVAHKDESTANLFRMSKRFYDYLPPEIKPMTQSSNGQEIIFDAPSKYKGAVHGLRSRIRCATAGGDGVGRSYTLQNVHMSELAFWPGNILETYAGIMQAVPNTEKTIVIIESTANGYNAFKKLWDDAVKAQKEGTDGFLPVFFPWYEMQEYRMKPPPDFTRTAEEEELTETFGLDDEQLMWRRWCIRVNCGGDTDLFHQEYPCTPDEAFISTGRCVFDKNSIVLRREQVKNLEWERGVFRVVRGVDGKISDYEWDPDERGPIKILKHPKNGWPYVLGGDTAGTGSDFFAGQLIDNITGEQVAVIHHQVGERMFAEQVWCLGMYYNKALIGIETNYSTYPEMVLEELGYDNLYVRERYDNFTGKTVPAFGFETTTATRPVLVDNLKDVARQAIESITDFDTLGEMLTFVYDDKWKPQAEQGEHDDLVMALGIAHLIRGQQRATVEPPKDEATSKWTPDMWEDYRHADQKMKEYLISKWGSPK